MFLWTGFVALLLLWLSGMVADYTLGGWIHLLLAMAVLLLFFQVTTRAEKASKSQTSEVKNEK